MYSSQSDHGCDSKEVHVCAYHMAELPRAIAEHQVAELTGDRRRETR